jgi:hypothetical protein
MSVVVLVLFVNQADTQVKKVAIIVIFVVLANFLYLAHFNAKIARLENTKM